MSKEKGKMQEKRYDDAKKEIRSVLLTYQSSISLEEFLKTYKGLIGRGLPSRTVGFSSDVEFLQSMPDVVSVFTDRYGKILLTGIADEASVHIQKLVSKQRKQKPNNSRSNKRLSNYRMPVTSIKEMPFVPGTLRAEILKLMAMYPDGVTFSTFALAYRRKFNKFLPLARGFNSLESMISLMPELEVKTENNERRICYRDSCTRYNCQEISDVEKTQEAKVSDNNREEVLQIKPSNIHKSGITEDVLKDFQLVLKNCPGGIPDIHFPAIYKNLTGRNFDLIELGYNSIIELADALPHIFKRILNPKDDKNWIILPAEATVKHCFEAQKSSVSSPRIQTPLKIREGIPADAAAPSLQYRKPIIPEHVDLTQYVPVFVSAIVNPSLFWFQLMTDDVFDEFEKFEKELGNFYDCHANYNYTLCDADITIGSTCIVCCPEDKQWYRAVIKSIPDVKHVNVFFVDYGSRENVPKTNLRYVRSKYHEYPAYAFEAQLAGLKTPGNVPWSIKAQQKFIRLCESPSLMAKLKLFAKGAFSVYLCDTSGDIDIHINDVLIKEGFAEFCPENHFDGYDSCLPEDTMSNGTKSDSECYFSSESSDQCISQSNENNFITESKIVPANQNLAFSIDKLANDVESNISLSGEAQNSKRYVKQMQLCDEKKIHCINLENKLYTTCGDVARLLWSDKDSSFLIERLKYKEVDVPFLKLSREDYASVFKQCIWYKIPEFEKLESSNSSLLLCPLEWAFNILNIFGHPSVCLRLAIQSEIRNFDPFDPVWKEFCCEESLDLTDIEKEIAEKLRKLCSYDLKAKREAFKIKKIKLQRAVNTSTHEEIKRINNLQNIIERRMKEIEAICSQYSSCS